MKKRDDEIDKIKAEMDMLHAKTSQDYSQMMEKLQRLAAQFDKELMARDNKYKSLKSVGEEDFQRTFTMIQSDLELTRKQLNEIEVKKADKREVLDFKQKSQLSMDSKIDKAEVHSVITEFTQDQSSKSFAFRKELFEKIKDIENDITQSVAQFV